ncbi:MAG: nucleoside monophosphate kinase [Candidatus Paceibacterota bacterium]|jgi:adenylate kinase
MKPISNQKVVVIFGAPGSGKGTQAKLVADKYGLYNFDTGLLLRRLLHDPKFKKNREIQKERVLNDDGKLNTPSFVLKMVRNKVVEIARENIGLVFSGSPRTLFEAFGDTENEGLLSYLLKMYERKNIIFFFLSIPEKESIERNSKRTVCSICEVQLLGVIKNKPEICPFCGGKLIKRIDDNPELMQTRLDQFKSRTFPIFSEMKKRGYKINQIDGTILPYKVFENISKRIS